jgi:molybdopterin-synthase adenylyltransferase
MGFILQMQSTPAGFAPACPTPSRFPSNRILPHMPAFTTHGPHPPNAATESPASNSIPNPIPDPISDTDRYSRQILFAPIGEAGQQLLARAHVAIVGVGATGAATASLLARAGVGRLTRIDRDFVEPSNLQRQMLFDEDDARSALPKAEAARRHLARINSSVHIDAHITDLVPQNAPDLLSADIVLDCTDNFETRYLINDLCVRDHRPWIYAAAVGAYAATMNILPRRIPSEVESHPSEVERRHSERSEEPLYLRTERSDVPLIPNLYPQSAPTACLACIFPSAPSGNIETCDTAGILSTAVNLAASLQVTEALKFLTRQPERMRRTLISFDLWQNTRSEISTTTPREDCEVCGQRIFRALSGEQRPHITLCGRNSVQIHQHHHPLNLAELESRLRPLGQVRANGLLLRFSYPPYTLTIFPDGRALIQGTTDIGLARSLYARFIGS